MHGGATGSNASEATALAPPLVATSALDPSAVQRGNFDAG